MILILFQCRQLKFSTEIDYEINKYIFKVFKMCISNLNYDKDEIVV